MSELKDYRVPGTNLISWPAYSRDNIPKPPHKIPVGWVVEVEIDHIYGRIGTGENYIKLAGRARLYVVKHHEDCDGTALYWLAAKPIIPPEDFSERIKWEGVVGLSFHGYSEESLHPVPTLFSPVKTWVEFKRSLFGSLDR